MKTHNNKIIPLLCILVVLFTAIVPVAAFATETLPDWLVSELQNGNIGSTSSSGASLNIGTPITSAPPVVAPPPVYVPPAPVTSEAPTSTAMQIPSRELPPPPSVDEGEEWVYDDASLQNNSAASLPRMDISLQQRDGFTTFFVANWWWIVGIAVLLVGVIAIVIIRKRQ